MRTNVSLTYPQRHQGFSVSAFGLKTMSVAILLHAVVLLVPVAAVPVLGIAACLALYSSHAAVCALVLSWWVSMLNPGIVGEIPGLFFLKLAVLSAVFVRAVVLVLWFKTIPKSAAFLLFFCIYIMLFSANSQMPSLSLLKAILFTFGSTGVVIVAWWLPEPGRTIAWIRVLLITTAWVSLPFVVLPAGYLRNGSGFQGILNHPQAFGLFSSILACGLLLDLVLGEKKRLGHAFFSVSTSGLLVFFVIQSEARVALISLIVSVFLTIFAFSRRQKGVVFLSIVVVFGSLFFTMSNEAQFVLSQFLLKRTDGVQSLWELYWNSRGFLLERSLENVATNLLFGIGFGIPSHLESVEIVYSSAFNLPISAPVEKGFFGLALLEEAGIVGVLLFALFLISFLRRYIKSNSATAVGLFLITGLMNTTESTVFSMSGFGLLFWVLLSCYNTRRGNGTF